MSVCVLGEIPEELDIVRKSDAILHEEIDKFDLDTSGYISRYF
ncbi:hypothetical protein WKH33_06200 [Priestia sp. WB3]